MNLRAEQQKQALRKTIAMVAEKKFPVTMRGPEAFVQFNEEDGSIVRMNIPAISDGSSKELRDAIMGFADHEIAHTYDTDGLAYAAHVKGLTDRLGISEAKARFLMNVLEDVRIEKLMAKRFRGAEYNLDKTRAYVASKLAEQLPMARVQGDQAVAVLMLVVYVRARAGQPAMLEFMKANELDRVYKPIDEKLPGFSDKLRALQTIDDVAALAEEFFRAVGQVDENQTGGQDASQEEPQENEDDSDESDGEDESDSGPESEDKQSGETGSSGEEEAEEQEDDDEGASSDGSEDTDGEDEEDESQADGEGSEASDAEDDGEDESEGSGEADSEDADEGDSDEGEDGEGAQGEEEDDKTSTGTGDDQSSDDGTEEKSSSGDEGDEETDDATSGEDGETDGEQDTAEDGQDRKPSESSDEGDDEDGEADGEDDDGSPSDGEQSGDDQSDGDDLSETDEAPSSGGGYGADTIFPEDDADLKDWDLTVAEFLSKDAIDDFTAAAQTRIVDFDANMDFMDTINPERYPNRNTAAMEEKVQKTAGALSKELQRLIAARSISVKTPGFRSGRIHGPSLHRITRGDDRAFFRKQVNRSKDVAVSLLVDCSGSMQHANKINVACEAAWVFTDTLSRLGIKNEVMGFTTTGMNGDVESRMNEAREFADRHGVPRNHLRCVPSREILFKGFEESFTRKTKDRLAAMPHTGAMMQGNQDHIAVRNAAMRLLQRKEERRIMFVFSDGFPAGGYDLSAGFAALARMVDEVEHAGVEVIGIGINSDAVKNFYKKNAVITDIEQLPAVTLKHLRQVLTV